MTTSHDTITIRRADLAATADRLAGRVGDASAAAVEAALWCWLQHATSALVDDGDTLATRDQHGFLPRAFADALGQEVGR